MSLRLDNTSLGTSTSISTHHDCPHQAGQVQRLVRPIRHALRVMENDCLSRNLQQLQLEILSISVLLVVLLALRQAQEVHPYVFCLNDTLKLLLQVPHQLSNLELVNGRHGVFLAFWNDVALANFLAAAEMADGRIAWRRTSANKG